MKLPSSKEVERLHRKYAPNDAVYDLVYTHCRIVAEIAVWCAGNLQSVDVPLLTAAALLHDIGSYTLLDEKGKHANKDYYLQHALLSAKLLADEGLDPTVTGIIETHAFLGLTKQEIVAAGLRLPARDYVPTSIEGELLCYADRFHSKHPNFNTYESFRAKMLAWNLPLQAEKFAAMARRFGMPDIAALAAKYGQTIV